MKKLEVVATGGTNWQLLLDGEFLGTMEFGSIDAEGQYVETDAEVVEYAVETFGLTDVDACVVS